MPDEEYEEFKEALRRIEEIEGWFRERGYILVFDAEPEGFGAFVMQADARVGEAVAEGGGIRQLDAAEDARKQFLAFLGEAGRVPVGQAEEVDLARPITVQKVEPNGIPSEEAFGTPTVQQVPPEVHELERIATDFGWRIGFILESDGSFRWLVFPEDGGEVLQHGVAPTWQDALLDAISSLHPPSGED